MTDVLPILPHGFTALGGTVGFDPNARFLVLQVPAATPGNIPQPRDHASHLLCTGAIRLLYVYPNSLAPLITVVVNQGPGPLDIFMPRRPQRKSFVDGNGTEHVFEPPKPPMKPRYRLAGGIASSWVELCALIDSSLEGHEYVALRGSPDLELCEYDEEPSDG